jgi:hypothetical protein
MGIGYQVFSWKSSMKGAHLEGRVKDGAVWYLGRPDVLQNSIKVKIDGMRSEQP